VVVHPLDFPNSSNQVNGTPFYLHIIDNSIQNDYYACFRTQYFLTKHSKQYANDHVCRQLVESIQRVAQNAFLMCLINRENNDTVYAVYAWARDNFFHAQCQNSELIANLIIAYNTSKDPWIEQWRMLNEQCVIINNLLTLDSPFTLCEYLENGSPQVYYIMKDRAPEQYALPTLSTIIIDSLLKAFGDNFTFDAVNTGEIRNILDHQTDDNLILMLQYIKKNGETMTPKVFMQHCKNFFKPSQHTWLKWDGTTQVAFFLLHCLTFGALFFISTMINDDHLSTQPMHKVLFISMMIGNFATAGILTAILGFIGNVGACPNVLGCYKVG
jgi:hypothetical protein